MLRMTATFPESAVWIFVAALGVVMLCCLVAAINKYWCGDDVPPADVEDGGKSRLEATGESGELWACPSRVMLCHA